MLGNELVVSVLGAVATALAHQPVKIAVRPRDESVEADADKDGALRFSFHGLSPRLDHAAILNKWVVLDEDISLGSPLRRASREGLAILASN